jgi:hypothetical protein
MPYHVGEKGSYGCSGYPAVKDDGEVMGCHKTSAAAQAQIYAINVSEGNIDKASLGEVTEGDFVIAMTSEGPIVGQVEHVMREGGTYGEPGNPYAVQSTPENPAVAIRILEEDDGYYKYTPYSIGALLSDVMPIDKPEMGVSMDENNDMNDYDPEDKGVGIKNPEEWPETKRDGGKFPSSMGQPHAASNGESVVKDPKKKPKRSRGGVGGDPTGAITAGAGGMSTKSDEEKTDAELFAGFGKDFTRVDRRLEVFLPEDK